MRLLSIIPPYFWALRAHLLYRLELPVLYRLAVISEHIAMDFGERGVWPQGSTYIVGRLTPPFPPATAPLGALINSAVLQGGGVEKAALISLGMKNK